MLVRHPLLSLVTLAYLAAVAWLTLTPQAQTVDSSLLWRFADFFARFEATRWATFPVLEFAANIALFVPFGLFFVLLLGRRRWWIAVLLGAAATVGIELAQREIAGRVSDPRDLLANTLGTVLGTLVALVLTAARARRERRAREAVA